MIEDHRFSQQQRILKALLGGDKLTSLEALERFGCLRLAAQVFALKKKGYNIKSEMITVPSGKRVAEYSIPQRWDWEIRLEEV